MKTWSRRILGVSVRKEKLILLSIQTNLLKCRRDSVVFWVDLLSDGLSIYQNFCRSLERMQKDLTEFCINFMYCRLVKIRDSIGILVGYSVGRCRFPVKYPPGPGPVILLGSSIKMGNRYDRKLTVGEECNGTTLIRVVTSTRRYHCEKSLDPFEKLIILLIKNGCVN